MNFKMAKKLMISVMISCLLAGCGNTIPELTDAEVSLIATYAADVLLENSREKTSRLMDTEAETIRRGELAEKVEQLKEKQNDEEETEEEGTQETGDSAAGAATGAGERTENIADFIGLDGFQVSYDGYEIRKSYQEDDEAEWEPTFDASPGKNLLVLKLKITNISGATAVADVLSKDMLFSINGDGGINGMAFVTMLLNDFTYARDEIEAGESKQYVLITQIDESITEAGSLTLQMKKGDERASVLLQ